MITRILIAKDGRYFYQHDSKDVSTHRGHLAAAVINDAADGTVIESNLREQYTIISPSFLDRYRRLERGPQLMTLKDLGFIAAEVGLGQESIVGEAGTGTGASGIYFARIAKQVYSFDIVPEHLELGKRNAEKLGMQNITFAMQDVYESIPDHQYDLLLLDNPEAWRALPHLASVKIGGWIVAYLPSINQAAQFANAAQENEQLQYRKTVELIEREWSIKGLRVRPSSDALGHTAFLVFARRIR